MDYSSIIATKRSRLATLEAVMGDQNFFDDIREPVDPPVLIFGPERGKYEFGEEVETAHVIVAERVRNHRERLQDSQARSLAVERDEHSGAGSELARQVEFDTGVHIAIVAAQKASGIKAVLQELGIAGQLHPAIVCKGS